MMCFKPKEAIPDGIGPWWLFFFFFKFKKKKKKVAFTRNEQCGELSPVGHTEQTPQAVSRRTACMKDRILTSSVLLTLITLICKVTMAPKITGWLCL